MKIRTSLTRVLSAMLALVCVVSMTDFNRVRAVDYTSSTYEYAGSFGESTDPANGYVLGNPVGIAKDSLGYFYVADMANGRIVKLNSQFRKVDTIENIDMPLFVYVDNNDYILVNELGTNKILKYSQELELVDSWGGAGTGDGEFNIPRSIVQDSRGNYYVSDELNHRIQKFTEDGDFIASYGSYGTGTGQFAVQQGLSIDANDRVYVADTYNNRIQVFNTYPSWEYAGSFGTYGVYVAANATSFQPEIMNHPRGVYVDKETGRIVVTDSSNNRVMVYNSFEQGFSFYQSQNGYLGMSLPTHAIMDNGFLIVLDSHSRILKYNSILNNTNLFTEHGIYRNAPGVVSNAQSVCVNQNTGKVYVSDSFNHRIQMLDADGNLVATYGGIGGPYGYGTALNYFLYPKQVAVDKNNTLYVADFGNGRIVKKYAAGVSFIVAAAVVQPWGVAVDNSGYLYVSDWYTNSIKVFLNGVQVRSWGGSGTANGKFNKPCDLKIGTYNGRSALYVADCGNNRVQIFSLTGTYLGQLGTPETDPLGNYTEAKASGAMLLPYGITIDAEGNVIVSDTSHKCMRMYDSNGNLLETWGAMSSSAGNFFSPMGCDINRNTGRLYITDGVLQRVQYYDVIE